MDGYGHLMELTRDQHGSKDMSLTALIQMLVAFADVVALLETDWSSS